jgi:chromosome segregation ATPase
MSATPPPPTAEAVQAEAVAAPAYTMGEAIARIALLEGELEASRERARRLEGELEASRERARRLEDSRVKRLRAIRTKLQRRGLDPNEFMGGLRRGRPPGGRGAAGGEGQCEDDDIDCDVAEVDGPAINDAIATGSAAQGHAQCLERAAALRRKLSSLEAEVAALRSSERELERSLGKKERKLVEARSELESAKSSLRYAELRVRRLDQENDGLQRALEVG